MTAPTPADQQAQGELLPCPFDGTRPVYRWIGGTMYVECPRCGIGKGDGGMSLNDEDMLTSDERETASKASAAARWNRRSNHDSQ